MQNKTETKTQTVVNEKKTESLAIVSLVFGILSIVLGWFPIFGWIFIILALVFGILAYQKVIKENKEDILGRNFAIAGTVMGGIGIILAIIFWATAITGYSSTCADMNCFITAANNCTSEMKYQEVKPEATFEYSVIPWSDNDNNSCVFTKKITALNANENPFMKKVLLDKELSCNYDINKFDEKWVNSMFEDIESCKGELKEIIGQLLIIS